MIEAAFARFVVADILSSYETGAPCHRVVGGARWQMVGCFAEPVGTEVGAPRYGRIKPFQFAYIIPPVLHRHLARVEERRIAYDDVGFGPLGRQAIGGDEGVGRN